jgi:glycosyltransferase involved in cell wall biosynthesis
MADRLRPYVSGTTALQWVPLWTLDGIEPAVEATCDALRERRGWERERTVLLYSGNLGLGHRFDEFLAAARELGPSGPRWIYSGSGRGRPVVERFIVENEGLPIQLVPHVPSEELAAHLGSADIHLASVDPAWDGLILPSKVQGSFAVGKPVLFVGSREHEIAQWIAQSGGGWHILPSDARGLTRLLRSSSRGEQRERGQAARAFAEREFSMSGNVARVIDCLLSGS